MTTEEHLDRWHENAVAALTGWRDDLEAVLPEAVYAVVFMPLLAVLIVAYALVAVPVYLAADWPDFMRRERDMYRDARRGGV